MPNQHNIVVCTFVILSATAKCSPTLSQDVFYTLVIEVTVVFKMVKMLADNETSLTSKSTKTLQMKELKLFGFFNDHFNHSRSYWDNHIFFLINLTKASR